MSQPSSSAGGGEVMQPTPVVPSSQQSSSHAQPDVSSSWTCPPVQSTPAKRSSPSAQDRIAKRHSTTYPTTASSPTHATPSANAAADGAMPPTAPWPTSFRHATTSHAPVQSTSAQAHTRSQSVASASQPSSTILLHNSASQVWDRRHSLTSAMQHQPPEAEASSSGAVHAFEDYDDIQQHFPAHADNRTLPTIRQPAVARSPAFPRGLEQEEAFSDLSILGYPMPQPQPDPRAPERLADRPDEWGLLSEMGPISRSELNNVSGWNDRVHGRQPNTSDFARFAAGPSAPPASAPAVPPALRNMRARESREFPNIPAFPPSGSPQPDPPRVASARVLSALDFEAQTADVSRDRFDWPTSSSDESEAGESPGSVNALLRRARRRAMVRPSAEMLPQDAYRSARLGIAAPLRTTRAAAASHAVSPGPAPLLNQPPSAAPIEWQSLRGFRALSPPPRRERNNAVRDWRNGVAQHSIALPPGSGSTQRLSALTAGSQSGRPARPDSHVPSPLARYPPPTDTRLDRTRPPRSDTPAAQGTFPPFTNNPPDRARPPTPIARERPRASPGIRPDIQSSLDMESYFMALGQIRSHSHGRLSELVQARPDPRTSSPPNTLMQHHMDASVASTAVAGGTTRSAIPPPMTLARRRAVQLARFEQLRRENDEQFGRTSEPEPDVAGAPPSSGLRPLLLAGHVPYRAGQATDERARQPVDALPPRPSHHRGAPARHVNPYDPLAIASPHPLLRRRYVDEGGFTFDPSTIEDTAFDADGVLRPSEFPTTPGMQTALNPLRADGGDPIRRQPLNRYLQTSSHPIPPVAGPSGLTLARQDREARIARTQQLASSGNAYGAHEQEPLFSRIVGAAMNPEDRACRVIACALVEQDPLAYLASNTVNSPEDYRLRPEMTPEARTLLLMRIARATSMFPALSRRNFMTAVLVRSSWSVAKVDGEKDECCAICQEDYEPNHRVSVTPCNHMYHVTCMDTWIKTPNVSTCPMCRRDLALMFNARRLCVGGKEAALKLWLEFPTDMVPPREF
ncbi:hypothetical protein CC85DRAFT_292550 [Cutaneotrichosporon oleaginosum]|uniref:RING-type domain-containing protein n=1 Tax=Cutaneotrichosporon oleaginosum TaxID=879819 RepID=A0A0J1B1W0_9TREE|nr:uncharacterized protein CC85DRAFT_292550 [Cutaneotrichosporon oleaginosum]KLT41604.1 hypothetical protein CC85DRAFT_292550 [Cutaneotrichosporon oleaginosum]TXT08157.1 hypothetical protein COLE_05081 [Cutaneotrichosporon oleaginosum]